MQFSLLADITASDLFKDENINWKYCKERATFVHVDSDACEFILHIGDDEHATKVVQEMKQRGCTPEFIRAYVDAWDAGAMRVLFNV